MPNRKLVLVVDDDPGMLRAVKRLLRQFGYDSLLFETAAAFEAHDDIDKAICIIMDINLNGASGPQPARACACHGRHIRTTVQV